MSRWFRFYDEALDDPKVQNLPGDLFKLWVNILCIASKHGGVLPPIDGLAFALRTTPEGAAEAVDRLARGGLVAKVNADRWAPHNWNKRQYKSDTSTPRVKRFRNVTETPPDTEQNRYTPRKRGGMNGFNKISAIDYAKSWEIRSKAQLAEREEAEQCRKR